MRGLWTDIRELHFGLAMACSAPFQGLPAKHPPVGLPDRHDPKVTQAISAFILLGADPFANSGTPMRTAFGEAYAAGRPDVIEYLLEQNKGRFQYGASSELIAAVRSDCIQIEACWEANPSQLECSALARSYFLIGSPLDSNIDPSAAEPAPSDHSLAAALARIELLESTLENLRAMPAKPIPQASLPPRFGSRPQRTPGIASSSSSDPADRKPGPRR